jgi:hypothetical protein
LPIAPVVFLKADLLACCLIEVENTIVGTKAPFIHIFKTLQELKVPQRFFNIHTPLCGSRLLRLNASLLTGALLLFKARLHAAIGFSSRPKALQNSRPKITAGGRSHPSKASKNRNKILLIALQKVWRWALHFHKAALLAWRRGKLRQFIGRCSGPLWSASAHFRDLLFSHAGKIPDDFCSIIGITTSIVISGQSPRRRDRIGPIHIRIARRNIGSRKIDIAPGIAQFFFGHRIKAKPWPARRAGQDLA